MEQSISSHCLLWTLTLTHNIYDRLFFSSIRFKRTCTPDYFRVYAYSNERINSH
jgi:hypothetical protein